MSGVFDITEIPWTNVAVNMGVSFTFWYVAGYFLKGDKWAPALIGATVSGIRSVIKGPGAVGTLPDNLGVISATGYSSGAQEGGAWNFTSAVVSALVTFVFWIFAGYFVISGSSWKYATTAAIVAAAGGLIKS